jgi:hypothetical protein
MQFGTPDEIYDDPANTFTADFVGEPKINLFEGIARRQDGEVVVAVGRDGLLPTAARTSPTASRSRSACGPRTAGWPLKASGPSGRGRRVRERPRVRAGHIGRPRSGRSDGRADAERRALADRRAGAHHRPPDRVYLFDVTTGDRIR